MRQTVRSLVAADAPAVAELEHEARTALRDQRGGPAHLAERPAVGEWVALLTMPGQLVWVATIDDVVVGYLQLQITATTAEVLQVYVHPDARGGLRGLAAGGGPGGCSPARLRGVGRHGTAW